MRWFAAAALAVLPVAAADLKPETMAAFDRYIQQTEQRLNAEKGKLWADGNPERVRRARAGEVVVEPFGAKALINVKDGMIHDWVSSAFLPGVTVEKALALAQDYDDHEKYYRPEVVDAKLLSRDGNRFRVFMRLLKKQVITVVLDTEHDIQYEQVGPKSWRSSSSTTRISEIADAGEKNEKALPPGKGNGFLWKLSTYWRFVERDGGTWIECEAISLTRDIPTGLGWIVTPVIRSLPRNSLQNTLNATRAALTR